MNPDERTALIARAKALAVPVSSCVAASIRPDHLLATRSWEELAALVVVLAEAAHPVRLREVVRAGGDGLEAQGIITPQGGYFAGRRNAGQIGEYAALRGNGMAIGQAAERLGIVKRTAEKYEALLIAAGKATWREGQERAAREADRAA